ncbi:MAG: hypothetical protein WCX70_00490 [Candidatus Paceibacterota bacterium]|jgi:hypothetical protein
MESKPQIVTLAFPLLMDSYRLVLLGQDETGEKKSDYCLNCLACLVSEKETPMIVALKSLQQEFGLITRREDLRLGMSLDIFFSTEHRYRCLIFLAKSWRFDNKARKQNFPFWQLCGLFPKVVWPSDSLWALEVTSKRRLDAKAIHNKDGSKLLSFDLESIEIESVP